MAKNLKEAILKNQAAAQELDQALRDCLTAIRKQPSTVVEGRFRLLQGGLQRNTAGR